MFFLSIFLAKSISFPKFNNSNLHEKLIFLEIRYHFALQLSFTLIFETIANLIFLYQLLPDALQQAHYNFPIIIFLVCPIS